MNATKQDANAAMLEVAEQCGIERCADGTFNCTESQLLRYAVEAERVGYGVLTDYLAYKLRSFPEIASNPKTAAEAEIFIRAVQVAALQLRRIAGEEQRKGMH